MDDFYLPSSLRPAAASSPHSIGCYVDWQRLSSQVLEPLARGREARRQRYDWGTDRLAEWHVIPAGGTVIIEGVYAMRAELADVYDLRIWVECPPTVRLERGLARDGAAARDLWVNDWMPAEDRYIAAHQPHDKAHALFDGSGAACFRQDALSNLKKDL